MFMGLTIANVVGVPLATLAGEHLGWRAAFWGITALGVVMMAALRLTLPALPAPVTGNARAELRVLARPRVLGALALTVVGSSAMFTVFTYITPILREVMGASLGFVTAMLVLYGLGLTAGNWLGERFADRSVDRTLLVTLASLTAILIAFAAAMPFAVPTAVLVAAGREGRGTVAAGQPVTVQGRYDEGQLRASYIIDAAGKVTAVGPRGPGHDGNGPHRGPRHDGPPPPPPPGCGPAGPIAPPPPAVDGEASAVPPPPPPPAAEGAPPPRAPRPAR